MNLVIVGILNLEKKNGVHCHMLGMFLFHHFPFATGCRFRYVQVYIYIYTYYLRALNFNICIYRHKCIECLDIIDV